MPTQAQMETLRIMYNKQESVEKIAHALEVHTSTIYRWLKDIPKNEPRVPLNRREQLSFHQEYIQRRMLDGETQSRVILKEIKGRGFAGSKKSLTNYMTKVRRENPINFPPLHGQKPDTSNQNRSVPPRSRNSQQSQNTESTSRNGSSAPALNHQSLRPPKEHTLITDRCADDLAALSPTGGDSLLEVRFTPLGTIYATLPQGRIQHSKTVQLGQLDPDIYPRDRVLELLSTSNSTSLSQLKADIESARELLKDAHAEHQAQSEAAPDLELVHLSPEPIPQQHVTFTHQPNPRKAPSTEETNIPRELAHDPIASIRDRLTEEDTQEADQPEPQDNPEAVTLQMPTIEDAWNSVKSETPLHPERLEQTLSSVVQEIASTAGKLMPKNNTSLDIGKGFSLQRETGSLHVSINHTTPAGQRRGLLAPVSNAHGTGVRDALFHQHIHWWQPGDEDRLKWLDRKLKEQAAYFIIQPG